MQKIKQYLIKNKKSNLYLASSINSYATTTKEEAVLFPLLEADQKANKYNILEKEKITVYEAYYIRTQSSKLYLSRYWDKSHHVTKQEAINTYVKNKITEIEKINLQINQALKLQP